MLELWYKEKRTLVDFRRGPLGAHFDGFSADLKKKGYTISTAKGILGKCCQFNSFLIDQGIIRSKDLSEALIAPFIEAYYSGAAATGSKYSPPAETERSLKHLFAYLIAEQIYTPPPQKPVKTPYTWLRDSFVEYLQTDRGLSDSTIKYRYKELAPFLDSFGNKVERGRLKNLNAETVEKLLLDYFCKSTTNPETLSSIFRVFFSFCAINHFTKTDFSGLVPTVRSYRKASLPKGLEDSSIERMLRLIPKETEVGARDYAVIVLMMAYGIRGISAAELLLDDIDWRHSRIRIRAQKGGKEVVLPLMEPVGEAIVRYLKHRKVDRLHREVFLSVKAPFRPLTSVVISKIVRDYLKKAGIKVPGGGARTLRHSWAIRALENNTAIKAIADVLGHRYIDTTFIYAKADLNSLREVAMPWPGKD